MAKLYSNENFPLPAVHLLRGMGHDVLTSYEAGNANKKVPDDQVLAYAIAHGRAVLTQNRQDFIDLHNADPGHEGIVVCTVNPDPRALAQKVNQAIAAAGPLKGRLIRVTRG